MEGKFDSIQDFFAQLWSFVVDKHNQGTYNTICLVVLLTLPLLVFLTAVVVCCHCCCCRHANHCCCRCGDASRSETKKKKNSNDEDLWISVKTGPMTPDQVALAMVWESILGLKKTADSGPVCSSLKIFVHNKKKRTLYCNKQQHTWDPVLVTVFQWSRQTFNDNNCTFLWAFLVYGT